MYVTVSAATSLPKPSSGVPKRTRGLETGAAVLHETVICRAGSAPKVRCRPEFGGAPRRSGCFHSSGDGGVAGAEPAEEPLPEVEDGVEAEAVGAAARRGAAASDPVTAAARRAERRESGSAPSAST